MPSAIVQPIAKRHQAKREFSTAFFSKKCDDDWWSFDENVG